MSIGSAIGWTSLQHLVRLATGLVTALALARYLGSAQYGLYQSLVSWLLLFVALASGGLQSVVIQKLAVSPSPRTVLGTTLRLRLGWTSASCLLCLGLPVLLGWSGVEMGGLALLAPVLLLQLADLPDYWFQSRTAPRPVTIARTIGSLTALVGMGFGILNHQGVLFFCGAFLLEQSVGCGLLWWANHRSGLALRTWNFDWKMAQELAHAAWPMLLSTACLILYTRIDLVMLKSLSTPEETGWFAASSRLSQLWAFIPMALVNAIFPTLARTRQSDKNLYRTQSQTLFSLLGGSGLGFALVLSLGSSWIAGFLFGQEFSGTGPMLGIQGWITLCYFLRTGVDRWLVTEGLTRHDMAMHISSAAVNILLNLWWIPHYGGMGAALASLVAMAAGVWLFPLLFSCTRPVARHAFLGIFAPIFLLQANKRKALFSLLRFHG
ncbi:MAG TPA: flippase [Fibrobacteraceae bacterium]|nr:flippase [Fibrobacteraceae bacterium]